MTATITLNGRTQEVRAEVDTSLSAVGRQPVTTIEGLAGPVADAVRRTGSRIRAAVRDAARRPSGA
jgi:hypothetical protein